MFCGVANHASLFGSLLGESELGESQKLPA